MSDLVPKERIGIKELARKLGVNYITALGYVHDQKIKGVRVGGRWSVPTEELERFLREGNHPDSKLPEEQEEEDFRL